MHKIGGKAKAMIVTPSRLHAVRYLLEFRRQIEEKELKNHRNFTFGLSFEDESRTLHIFDKKTFWKVAEWR